MEKEGILLLLRGVEVQAPHVVSMDTAVGGSLLPCGDESPSSDTIQVDGCWSTCKDGSLGSYSHFAGGGGGGATIFSVLFGWGKAITV